MVLLEVVTILKPIDFERGKQDANLKTIALPFKEKKNIKAVVIFVYIMKMQENLSKFLSKCKELLSQH